MEEIACHAEGAHSTVAFATHNIEEVRRIADHGALLYEGHFLGLHEKDTLLERWKALWFNASPNPTPPSPGS